MMERIGKYQLIQHLGSGHFGDVFLCFDPFLQKERAVKLLKVPDPNAFVAAIKEGRAMDVCRHRHIVELLDINVEMFRGELVVAIVMEYLSKGSIQRHLEKRFFSVKEASKIIQESLLGLEHAHIENFLHCDVKPGNILLSDQGYAKLSDFGLATNFLEGSHTRGYRPHQPLEVIDGAPMDKHSDIYAMGITLYRLINNTNDLRFSFSSQAQWRKAVANNQYPPREFLAHIPDKFIRIINKAIHKEKDKRFQNCSEFRQALEKIKYNIDWRAITEDNWLGDSVDGGFSIERRRTRSGYTVDFLRNGRKVKLLCRKELSKVASDDHIVQLVRSTTLST